MNAPEILCPRCDEAILPGTVQCPHCFGVLDVELEEGDTHVTVAADAEPLTPEQAELAELGRAPFAHVLATVVLDDDADRSDFEGPTVVHLDGGGAMHVDEPIPFALTELGACELARVVPVAWPSPAPAVTWLCGDKLCMNEATCSFQGQDGHRRHLCAHCLGVACREVGVTMATAASELPCFVWIGVDGPPWYEPAGRILEQGWYANAADGTRVGPFGSDVEAAVAAREVAS
jgi:hypothetical protein